MYNWIRICSFILEVESWTQCEFGSAFNLIPGSGSSYWNAVYFEFRETLCFSSFLRKNIFIFGQNILIWSHMLHTWRPHDGTSRRKSRRSTGDLRRGQPSHMLRWIARTPLCITKKHAGFKLQASKYVRQKTNAETKHCSNLVRRSFRDLRGWYTNSSPLPLYPKTTSSYQM